MPLPIKKRFAFSSARNSAKEFCSEITTEQKRRDWRLAVILRVMPRIENLSALMRLMRKKSYVSGRNPSGVWMLLNVVVADARGLRAVILYFDFRRLDVHHRRNIGYGNGRRASQDRYDRCARWVSYGHEPGKDDGFWRRQEKAPPGGRGQCRRKRALK